MTITRRDLVGVAALGAGIGTAHAATAEAPGPVLDARAFGAVGDGVNDDGAALQRAIDALPTAASQREQGGGTVAVPPGTFRLTRTLTLDHGVTLRGAGAKATLVQADERLAGPLIAFDRRGQPPAPDRVAVRDLFLRGTEAPGQTGILFDNVHSWAISDCWIGWCDVGVHLASTWVGEMRNVRCHGNRSVGLRTVQTDDGGAHQIVFTASLFTQSTTGMVLDGSQYCWLIGCSFEKNEVGLLLDGTRNITVTAHFEANERSNIALAPADGHRPLRNVVITGSTLSVSSKDRRVVGVVVGRAANVDIRGNWFFNRRGGGGEGIGVELTGGAEAVDLCPRSNTFQDLDRVVTMRKGERLADGATLNAGVLPIGLFGGWAPLARFAADAYEPENRGHGIDVVIDADIAGPLDLADLPAGTRVLGAPGRLSRTVRLAGGGGAIALRRPGQSVENLRVVLEGGDRTAAAVLLDGPRQRLRDVALVHGSATAIRLSPAAAGARLLEIDHDGDGPALDDPTGLAFADPPLTP